METWLCAGSFFQWPVANGQLADDKTSGSRLHNRSQPTPRQMTRPGRNAKAVMGAAAMKAAAVKAAAVKMATGASLSALWWQEKSLP